MHSAVASTSPRADSPKPPAPLGSPGRSTERPTEKAAGDSRPDGRTPPRCLIHCLTFEAMGFSVHAPHDGPEAANVAEPAATRHFQFQRGRAVAWYPPPCAELSATRDVQLHCRRGLRLDATRRQWHVRSPVRGESVRGECE
eukprot:7384388-Prymnesium_polylepis.2